MKPEKKLQTAEIEICRLVTSNGVFGDENVVNQNLGFRFLDPNFGVGIYVSEAEFLMFWSTFQFLRHDLGLQKSFFAQILSKNDLVESFRVFQFLIFSIF